MEEITLIVGLCAIVIILAINVAFCCSKYNHYWSDPKSGNRYVSIWIQPRHTQQSV